jgi:hypothetical protein
VTAIDHPEMAPIAGIARSELAEVENRISTLLDGDEREATAHIRHVVDHMCRLTDWVALATQLQWEKIWGVEADTADALELYRLTKLQKVDPQDAPELVDLNRRFAATI